MSVMSKKFMSYCIGWIAAALLLVTVGCKKSSNPPDPNPSVDFREYKLFNYSSGEEVDAGSFRLDQLLNGNTKLTITISVPFRQDGVLFNALINTRDSSENELVFSNLGTVPGKTGVLVVNPVVGSGSNLPVKFNDLLDTKGYYVKILNGANVQATGGID